MASKIWIYVVILFVLASTTTSNSSEDVQVRLLDNQNAPLVATLDMSKADERIKQFVSDAIEANMKKVEETVKSKQFESDAREAKVEKLEVNMNNLKSQMANFEKNLTNQLIDYINGIVGKVAEENEKSEKPNQRPIDCKDVKIRKGNGVYKIYPDPLEPGFDVYCDFETDNGGWTVFQRRLNGKTDFFRGLEAYKNGFGDLETECWLGNQRIHALTAAGKSELRVDISDFDGKKAYAKYSTFAVGDAVTNYKLTVAGYSGNAGDSLDYSNGQAFTTKDRDNDPWKSASHNDNCGILRQGAWWYKDCAYSNLNGVHIERGQKSSNTGLRWYYWKNTWSSMKSSSMMIRRL